MAYLNYGPGPDPEEEERRRRQAAMASLGGAPPAAPQDDMSVGPDIRPYIRQYGEGLSGDVRALGRTASAVGRAGVNAARATYPYLSSAARAASAYLSRPTGQPPAPTTAVTPPFVPRPQQQSQGRVTYPPGSAYPGGGVPDYQPQRQAPPPAATTPSLVDDRGVEHQTYTPGSTAPVREYRRPAEGEHQTYLPGATQPVGEYRPPQQTRRPPPRRQARPQAPTAQPSTASGPASSSADYDYGIPGGADASTEARNASTATAIPGNDYSGWTEDVTGGSAAPRNIWSDVRAAETSPAFAPGTPTSPAAQRARRVTPQMSAILQPSPDNTRVRVATPNEGLAQANRPWWQRALAGAGYGAIAGAAHGGLGGAIGGAITGGATSGASRGMARALASNVVDIPRQDIRDTRAARQRAQERIDTLGDLGIKEKEQGLEAGAVDLDWSRGQQGRYETDQERENRREAFLNRQQDERELEARQRHHIEAGHLGVAISSLGQKGGQLTKYDEDTRDRYATNHATGSFTPEEATQIQQEYVQQAYKAAGGDHLDRQIAALEQKRQNADMITRQDTQRDYDKLQAEKDRRLSDAEKTGRARFGEQMEFFKNGYRNLIDANGGEVPDLGKLHGNQPYTEAEAQRFGDRFGFSLDQAARVIRRLHGVVLKPGEQAPAPAPAPAQDQGVPNYRLPQYWE